MKTLDRKLQDIRDALQDVGDAVQASVNDYPYHIRDSHDSQREEDARQQDGEYIYNDLIEYDIVSSQRRVCQ